MEEVCTYNLNEYNTTIVLRFLFMVEL